MSTMKPSHNVVFRDFPRPDLEPNNGKKWPLPNEKMSKNFPKDKYHSHFPILVKKFMRIQSKIPELQMHKKLHKNVNEHFNGNFHVFFFCRAI